MKFKFKIELKFPIVVGSTVSMNLNKGWFLHTITEIDEDGRIFGIEEGKEEIEYLFDTCNVEHMIANNELWIVTNGNKENI